MTTRRANISWGIRQGLILTGIVLVPGIVAFALSNDGDRTEAARFVKIVSSYLAYGAVGGALAGIWRDKLRRKSGAAGFGALLGAATLPAFILFSDVRGSSAKFFVALLAIALAGAILGALVGWYAWDASRRHGRL
jgi:peptidoglycan/LPS O-acetylase OafA/YrhL